MKDHQPQHIKHVRTLSRRDLLRIGAGVAGAAGVVSGGRFAWPLVAGKNAKVPSLAARATPQSGELLSFRSRPDLRPAAPTVKINRPGQTGGLILMDTHNGPGDQGPLILDGSGNVVWFKPVSSDATYAKRAMNVREGIYRGQPVLSYFEGAIVNEHGVGQYVLLGQDYSVVRTVQAGNGYQADLHEFFLTPQGTAYLTSYGLDRTDLSSFGGEKDGEYMYGVAQEIDLETGKVLFQWRSDEHVSLEDSYTTPKEFSTGPWDYFHINSISLDGNGDLLISSRNTWAVYKVSRSTGEVLWRMGGKQSDFAIAPNAEFAWQHDVQLQPDGSVTMFDNGAGLVITQTQSRALVLSLDTTTRRVELVQQYYHPDGVMLADALGSVQLLAGGQTFVCWGNYGAWSQFSPTGEPLFDGQLAGSTTLSYRAFRSPWTGFPKSPPDISVEPNGAGVSVYASWNGATEVAQWLVLGGSRRKSLSPIGLAGKVGFETEITLPTRPAYVAVAALSASGKRLGVSGTIGT